MARVLVIEDERDLQKVLVFNLRADGHEPLSAFTAADGLALARAERPDVVLLDLMLPDGSGTEVCKLLKAEASTSRIPIVMLTAKGQEIDRVVGFELGADDYLVKPFSVRELMLRIRAVLRRHQPPDGAQAEPAMTFGHLSISPEAHRVTVDGHAAELTALEFRLLLTLFERRDRVQTRSALLSDVWDIQAELTTRTVDTHVKRLREKLGVAGDYIETVRGVGYRFKSSPG